MIIIQILSAQPGTKLLVEIGKKNIELPIVAWALVKYDIPLDPEMQPPQENREVIPLVIVPGSIVPVLANQVRQHYQPKDVAPYSIKVPR